MANKNQIFVYKICLLSVLIMSILYTDPDIETQQISTHFNNTNINNNNSFVRNNNITVEKAIPHKKLVKSGDKLRLDFYEKSCENVLRIISSTVVKIVNENNKAPAQLLRLMFHDCFIQGCDGSILLEKNSNSSIPAERFAKPSETLKGFEYVDRIKDDLEKVCPGTVSCSDILVIATRDALNLSGGPFFTVLMGRKDSLDSYYDLAIADIPKPDNEINETLGKFTLRGFSPRDTVALLGSHNIGKMDCKFIKDRVNNFKNSSKPDPILSSAFLAELGAKCLNVSDAFIPSGSEFGPKYYQNLVQGRGLLHADQVLMTHNDTADVVRGYAADSTGTMFRNDFMKGMSKFVNRQDQTALQGEVRLICSRKNNNTISDNNSNNTTTNNTNSNNNSNKDNNNKDSKNKNKNKNKKNTTDATGKSAAAAKLNINIWYSLVFALGLCVSITIPALAGN